jgi:putative hemolysin
LTLVDHCLNIIGINIKVLGLEKIPIIGPVICVANHPLGGADALALISKISKVREDIKIVANSYLSAIKPLKQLFLVVEQNKKTKFRDIKNIYNAIDNDELIIIFPAGAVSRFSLFKGRIVEKKWKDGIINIAQKYNVPIVPIYIDARNSNLFYISSLVFSPAFGTLCLPRQMFTKYNNNIKIIIGNPLLHNSMRLSIKHLQTHVYSLKEILNFKGSN